MLMLMLTIVSSACGAWSLRLAQEQRDLAINQVHIALIEACTNPDATQEMRAYCEANKIWRSRH
jgi:hypothetical protein